MPTCPLDILPCVISPLDVYTDTPGGQLPVGIVRIRGCRERQEKERGGMGRRGLRLEKHESEAWIMQARQKMKTRCGLLFSAGDERCVW